MTDNQMPTLTLEPSAQTETGIADLSSASIAAPAAPSIGLTLDAGQGAQQTATQDERDKNAVKIDGFALLSTPNMPVSRSKTMLLSRSPFPR